MPFRPEPRAVPHLWRWARLYPLAARSAELVPVGRGGERRAIGLGNPGLPGDPYATPTLWAAIQYLAPRENAPEHRHTQSAFRFVLEGEGVWTVVDGDPVAMRRGDLLLTPGWHFHGHQNVSGAPMAWLDGLDIPLVATTDQGFFEFGPDELQDTSTPDRSRGERLWGGPGLVPVSAAAMPRPASPLMAYRWAHTDEALRAQLELESEGHPGVVEPGHAAVRFTNPTTGGDALTTMRTEMHRLRAGTGTARMRSTASSVWQVFDGRGTVTLDGEGHQLGHGDVFAVPSWCELALYADADLDLFTFSDAPVFEKLSLLRTEVSKLMRLATIRLPGGTRAVRIDGGQAVETGHSDVGNCLPPPAGPRARPPPRRPARGLFAGPRPGDPASRQGHLRRAELPQPHPGDGSGASRVPHPVRQVRGRAHRAARPLSPAPERVRYERRRPARTSRRRPSWSSAGEAARLAGIAVALVVVRLRVQA